MEIKRQGMTNKGSAGERRLETLNTNEWGSLMTGAVAMRGCAISIQLFNGQRQELQFINLYGQ
jgi:hypothetical protein